MFRPEILAPAGDLFKLKTAIRYGADAVYIAGRKFGLRSAAQNFSIAEITEGCAFAHQHNAVVYVVLNAFLFDEELEQTPPFLKALETAGVDALIVSDLGVVKTVQRHCNVPVHLSTQSSTLNSEAARFWKDQGVERIVLGREVSIVDAAKIKRDVGIEVELFTHGAMCTAYSGNCTISNYTAGRDSNRGGCIQSCRFKYAPNGDDEKAGFFFGSKDLEGIGQMQAFIDNEIDSLKIEGRMKSALYVATTARAYAQARDQLLNQQVPDFAALHNELNTMSHRDYTTGSLVEKASGDSIYARQDELTDHTHEMGGHVLHLTENHMAILLKNPLQAGETLEMLCPSGETIFLDTHNMKDLMQMPLDAGKPNQIILIDRHPKAGKDFLLRKQRNVIDHSYTTTTA